MLRKLYKHEFISLYRILLPLYVVLIGLSGITRLLSEINKNSNDILLFWKEMVVILSTITIIGIFVVGFVVIIVRFYQNLLSKQGYLTNTLPFKANRHIVCKLVCGIIVEISNVLVTAVSLFIMFGNKKGIAGILNVLRQSYRAFELTTGKANAIATIAEIPILVILAIATSLLMFYASMAIGQQFKNKILGSVIAYFCIYAVIQIVNTVFLTIIFAFNFDFKENLITEASVGALSQGLIIFLIFIELLQGTIYYLIANYFLSKKLNLE